MQRASRRHSCAVAARPKSKDQARGDREPLPHAIRHRDRLQNQIEGHGPRRCTVDGGSPLPVTSRPCEMASGRERITAILTNCPCAAWLDRRSRLCGMVSQDTARKLQDNIWRLTGSRYECGQDINSIHQPYDEHAPGLGDATYWKNVQYDGRWTYTPMQGGLHRRRSQCCGLLYCGKYEEDLAASPSTSVPGSSVERRASPDVVEKSSHAVLSRRSGPTRS